VTGSSGLIGSEVAVFFHGRGFAVHGVDNNQREAFFGPQGNTRWNLERLRQTLPGFTHHELDIRDRAAVLKLVETLTPPLSPRTTWRPAFPSMISM
jgi:CDP-paratose 2-epimerase